MRLRLDVLVHGASEDDPIAGIGKELESMVYEYTMVSFPTCLIVLFSPFESFFNKKIIFTQYFNQHHEVQQLFHAFALSKHC